jgi:uncharacterized protein YcfJ
MMAGVSGVTCGAELTGDKAEHAEVNQVTPVMRMLRTPRQSCRDEEVIYVQPKPQPVARSITGTVLGAIVGGLAGNQIGDGDGRRIATGVGAAVGAYTGNRIQERNRSENVFINTDRRCFTTIDMQEVLIGYDVRYSVRGIAQGLVRTSYDPGKIIPLRGGKLLLDGKTRTE